MEKSNSEFGQVEQLIKFKFSEQGITLAEFLPHFIGVGQRCPQLGRVGFS